MTTLSPPGKHGDTASMDGQTTLAPSYANSVDREKADDKLASKEAAGVDTTDADSVYRSKEENAGSGGSDGEDEQIYPEAFPLAMITIALCLVVFLVALDNTIIATAIPAITNQFNSVTDIGWYGSSYMLTTCCFQLIYGKLYTFWSLKWLFQLAVFLFEIGSLVCAVAPNSEALIVGRAIAGLGCAGIFSGALIILAHAVPLHKRPIYTGLIGGMYGIASVAGPLLGGVFTDKVTWRWCFYINLPIGALTMAMIFFFFTPPHRKQADEMTNKEKFAQFDILGTLFLLPSIICILLALQWGGTEYEWKNARIIVLFILFGILMGIFLFIQHKKGKTATLPFHLVKNRAVYTAALFSFAVGSGFFILVFYLPVWFQAVLKTSAMDSGIRNIPLILAVTVLSIVAGVLTTVFGHYAPFMIVGPVLAAIGTGLLTTMDLGTGIGEWLGYQVLTGVGIGLCFQQPMIAVQAALPLSDVATGTAMIVFAQTFGGALFISVAQNIFNNKIVSEVRKTLTIDPDVILMSGATGFHKKGAFSASEVLGIMKAYNEGIMACFYAAVAVFVIAFLVSLFVPWISVKGKKVEAVPA
ncbi:MFS general substrate transporter [Ascobolus immersus RN42]|uniref:MFS general substrate transporter n=1 Tax=Ascobolus immersus RN42 TaxID=1160509 RepID=A0A3N4ICF1_ASCIM|nr:MFS general substrate transporter [Ascobolus immersus RN42]